MDDLDNVKAEESPIQPCTLKFSGARLAFSAIANLGKHVVADTDTGFEDAIVRIAGQDGEPCTPSRKPLQAIELASSGHPFGKHTPGPEPRIALADLGVGVRIAV